VSLPDSVIAAGLGWALTALWPLLQKVLVQVRIHLVVDAGARMPGRPVEQDAPPTGNPPLP